MIRSNRNWWCHAAAVALVLMLTQGGNAEAQFGGFKVSNPVNEIKKQASSAGKSISNAGKSAGSTASKTVNNAKKTATSQAQKLGQTVKSTSSSAGSAAKRAQSSATDTARKSTQSLQSQGSRVGSTVSNATNNARQQQQQQLNNFFQTLNNQAAQAKAAQNQAQKNVRNFQTQTNNGVRSFQNSTQNTVQSLRGQATGGIQTLQRQGNRTQQQVMNSTQHFKQQVTNGVGQLPSRLPSTSTLKDKPPSRLPVSAPKPPSLSSIGVPKLPTSGSVKVGTPKVGGLKVGTPKVDIKPLKDVLGQPGKDLGKLTEKTGEVLVTTTTKPLEPLIGILTGGQEEVVIEAHTPVEEAPIKIEETILVVEAPPAEQEVIVDEFVEPDPNLAALELTSAIIGLVQTAVANGTPPTMDGELVGTDPGLIVETMDGPATDATTVVEPVEESAAEYTVLMQNMTEEPVTYSVRRAGSSWGTYTLAAGEEHKFVIPTEELDVRFTLNNEPTSLSIPGEHIYAFALDNGELGLFLADPEE